MKIDSRMMREIEYHPHRNSLFVVFNDGKVWEYTGVRVEIWELLNSVLTANRLLGKVGSEETVSFGRLFHYTIKIHPGKYPPVHHPELTTAELVSPDTASEGSNG